MPSSHLLPPSHHHSRLPHHPFQLYLGWFCLLPHPYHHWSTTATTTLIASARRLPCRLPRPPHHHPQSVFTAFISFFTPTVSCTLTVISSSHLYQLCFLGFIPAISSTIMTSTTCPNIPVAISLSPILRLLIIITRFLLTAISDSEHRKTSYLGISLK